MLERLIAWMGVRNAVWSWRNPNARETLEKRSFRSIKAEVYTFKALQEINSYAARHYPDNRQISMIGATLSGNQGAAAMLETTIGEIAARFPEANFVVHSYLPDADRKLLTAGNIRIVDASPKALVLSFLPALADKVLRYVGLRFPGALMPESLREIRNSTVLADVAGISLTAGREKFLPFNLLCNWPSVLVGTPVVKLAQAMGPGDSILTQAVARFILSRVQMTFARGERTMELITPVAPEDRRKIAADIAFLYKDDYALVTDWSSRLDSVVEALGKANTPVIALSVSSVVKGLVEKQGGDYLEATGETIERLLSKGYRVVVFPNACREETNAPRNNDIPIISAMADRFGDREGLYLVDYSVNTAAIRKMLKSCDALIASRFHAMVAGLSLGVPTLVLGWSHKYSEVMKMFGAERHFIGFEDLSSDTVLAAVEDLLTNQEVIRAEMQRHGPDVRQLSAVQFEWLDDFVRPKADETVTDG